MTVVVSEDTLRTAAMFKEMSAAGVETRATITAIAIELGVSKDVVRSRLRRQGLWGNYDFDKTFGRHRAGLKDADYMADRLIPPSLPVDRDPCPRCGVRNDIGCNHSRGRLGMVL